MRTSTKKVLRPFSIFLIAMAILFAWIVYVNHYADNKITVYPQGGWVDPNAPEPYSKTWYTLLAYQELLK